MRIHIGYLLLSILIGMVLLVGLVAFCYFAAHQNFAIVAILGQLLAFAISLPIFLYCGADCQPPIPVLVATAVFDVLWLSFPTYLILLGWRVRK
jgi:hypothetical protein